MTAPAGTGGWPSATSPTVACAVVVRDVLSPRPRPPATGRWHPSARRSSACSARLSALMAGRDVRTGGSPATPFPLDPLCLALNPRRAAPRRAAAPRRRTRTKPRPCGPRRQRRPRKAGPPSQSRQPPKPAGRLVTSSCHPRQRSRRLPQSLSEGCGRSTGRTGSSAPRACAAKVPAGPGGTVDEPAGRPAKDARWLTALPTGAITGE